MLRGISAESSRLDCHPLKPLPSTISSLPKPQVLVLDAIDDTGRSLMAILTDSVLFQLDGSAAENLSSKIATIRTDGL